MSLSSELNKALRIKEIKRSKHLFPLKDSTFRNKDLIEGICDTLSFYHEEHINNYGSDNEKRLTGLHETQSIEKFSYGVSDRGASIRIPVSTVQNNWKGYIEDRRPASNGDPYKITKRLLETLKTKLELVE